MEVIHIKNKQHNNFAKKRSCRVFYLKHGIITLLYACVKKKTKNYFEFQNIFL